MAGWVIRAESIEATQQPNSKGHQMRPIRIPRTWPEWLETDDHFVRSETATVRQWRAHNKRCFDRDVDQFVRIADKLGIADDVPLLSRLDALANENVTCLPNKRVH